MTEPLEALQANGFRPFPVPVPGGVDPAYLRVRDDIAELVLLARYGPYRVLRVPTHHEPTWSYQHTPRWTTRTSPQPTPCASSWATSNLRRTGRPELTSRRRVLSTATAISADTAASGSRTYSAALDHAGSRNSIGVTNGCTRSAGSASSSNTAPELPAGLPMRLRPFRPGWRPRPQGSARRTIRRPCSRRRKGPGCAHGSRIAKCERSCATTAPALADPITGFRNGGRSARRCRSAVRTALSCTARRRPPGSRGTPHPGRRDGTR